MDAPRSAEQERAGRDVGEMPPGLLWPTVDIHRIDLSSESIREITTGDQLRAGLLRAVFT
jgi:hypothetical protein